MTCPAKLAVLVDSSHEVTFWFAHDSWLRLMTSSKAKSEHELPFASNLPFPLTACYGLWTPCFVSETCHTKCASDPWSVQAATSMLAAFLRLDFILSHQWLAVKPKWKIRSCKKNIKIAHASIIFCPLLTAESVEKSRIQNWSPRWSFQCQTILMNTAQVQSAKRRNDLATPQASQSNTLSVSFHSSEPQRRKTWPVSQPCSKNNSFKTQYILFDHGWHQAPHGHAACVDSFWINILIHLIQTVLAHLHWILATLVKRRNLSHASCQHQCLERNENEIRYCSGSHRLNTDNDSNTLLR